MSLTYSKTGVDRNARAKAKKALSLFEKPKGTVQTPFNNLYPLDEKRGKYFIETSDGVGTKVLLTQLSGKHWVAGWDAIAMVVNDAIRCGAVPKSITDIIDIADSSGSEFYGILDGISRACAQAGCFVAGGETADVRELVNGFSSNPYHVNASCFAVVERKKIISGRNISPGNAIVGLESSGLHSNGFSLARRALFKQFGGAFDALQSDGKKVLEECVLPTKIYVKPFLSLADAVNVKAAVNITGDAFFKFEKLQHFSNVGFEFDFFKPQPIFRKIRENGGVSWGEMFKTFNMGWGFAVVVSQNDADEAVRLLARNGVKASVFGKVVKGNSITVEFEGEKIVLKK
ncbi:MAG: phosphoribosylformylglycinamidine cyclo-ligase [Candidatus Micrarchaeota archaeon]